MDQREVLLYTCKRSVRCWRAKRLLMRRGYDVKVVDETNDELHDLLKQFMPSTHRQRAPYLFVDHRPVGGFAQMRALDRSGVLEHLVRDEL